MISKTILITGASSGIGRDAALALAKAGHRVFAAARRTTAIEALRAEAPAIEALHVDLDSPASIAETWSA